RRIHLRRIFLSLFFPGPDEEPRAAREAQDEDRRERELRPPRGVARGRDGGGWDRRGSGEGRRPEILRDDRAELRGGGRVLVARRLRHGRAGARHAERVAESAYEGAARREALVGLFRERLRERRVRRRRGVREDGRA